RRCSNGSSFARCRGGARERFRSLTTRRTIIGPPISVREFWMLSVAGTLAFFALWTAIAMSGLVQTQFLPTPLAVLDKFVDLTRNPFVGYTLQQHLLSSFGRFASGFVL